MDKRKISVIIPVYMNEGSIHKTYVNITAVLKNVENTYDYSILFINDGSTDNSFVEIDSIQKIDSKVRIVNFTRNFVEVSAVIAGFEMTDINLIIYISADMQDPPELIEQMIKKWEEGYIVVACERIGREDSIIAKITSKIFYSLIKISIPKMPIGGCSTIFFLTRWHIKK